MEWQSLLISTYLSVCDAWKKGICESVRRHSNHHQFALTDEEVACIYLFGINSGMTSIRSIFDYTKRHLREWFPCLGGYKSFCYRLNRIGDSFIAISNHLSAPSFQAHNCVVDSMPILMAGPKRSSRAKVAGDLADKGFCASKDLYFYGVKIHLVGELTKGTLPRPVFIGLAPASANDHRMFEQISPQLFAGKVFADKAYADSNHQKQLEKNQNVHLLTPTKKTKGLFSFPGTDIFSSWVSSVRQPVESLFNWLQEKTKIQNASKVRSSPGLIVHVFGRIAAALLATTIC